LGDPKARREEGLWVAEGSHLAEEILRDNLPVRLWIFSERSEVPGSALRHLRTLAAERGQQALVVSDESFRGVSDTRTPQGVLCVVEAPVWSSHQIFARAGPLLALDAIQDPGNLGTLARSTEAAGGAGLLLGGSAVDAGNPKALRASAGSLLRLPTASFDDLAVEVRESGRTIYATTGSGGRPYDEVDLVRPFILMVGQEGRGLSPELVAIAEFQLTIPMVGEVESLNAATAASVILFEAARQRRHIDSRS
jgi:TrmH family RNA methyltransferase